MFMLGIVDTNIVNEFRSYPILNNYEYKEIKRSVKSIFHIQFFNDLNYNFIYLNVLLKISFNYICYIKTYIS